MVILAKLSDILKQTALDYIAQKSLQRIWLLRLWTFWVVNLTGDLWRSLHMVSKHISPVWEQIHGAPWWTHAESPRGRWRHQFLDCLLPHDAADPPPSFHIVLIFTQRYFSMQCWLENHWPLQWPLSLDLRGFLDILYCRTTLRIPHLLTFTLFFKTQAEMLFSYFNPFESKSTLGEENHWYFT